MHLFKVEFIISAVKREQYPQDDLPELVLAGRSNVGKSSLINLMLNRKHLARTSRIPGKTQTINFYRINDVFYFVDLPGYGFANVPNSVHSNWGKMMNNYLTERPVIKVIIQLLDLRHRPTQADIQMYQFCVHYGIPVILVATKSDKISKGQHYRYLKIIRQVLVAPSSVPIILFSSLAKTGPQELWAELEKFL